MKKKPMRWVAVSGGFDPIHVGHLRMLKKARSLGDKLVVILNNDNWLRQKKGYVFMSQKERAELLRELPFVDKVFITGHKKGDTDVSVCRAIEKLKPAIFANGGDRFKSNIPEVAVCKKLGIRTVFNIGGGKVQSSSRMISAARRHASKTVRPWGEYYGWDRGEAWNLKTIYIKPRKRLSLQHHKHRSESWVLVEGDATATIVGRTGLRKKTILKKGCVFNVPPQTIHRLESKRGGTVVEIAFGKFDEADIVRIEDDYGRK